MKISIAIPVLNDVRVGRALDSALSQQHEHELEVIVVDAGSTDGTLGGAGALPGAHRRAGERA